jgi:hypothetical protein
MRLAKPPSASHRNGLSPEGLRPNGRRLSGRFVGGEFRAGNSRSRFVLLLGSVELENGGDADLGNTVRDRHAIRSGAVILFVLAVAKLALNLNVGTLLESARELRELAPGQAAMPFGA